MRHVLSWHLTSSPTVNSDDAIFMRQETDSMCRMECFSVLFTKFYYFLLILKIISWNWLAILHLYPRWSSQQHIYILFTLSSFFVCLHISPQTEGVRTLQIMSKTSHRAKIHRTGGQNPSYRGQKSNIPCYNTRYTNLCRGTHFWSWNLSTDTEEIYEANSGDSFINID